MLTLLSLARESKREREGEGERERGRGREGERKSGLVSHMWKKSIAAHTRVWSAPGIIVALSDLMEDTQA